MGPPRRTRSGRGELRAVPGWQWGGCPAGNSEDTLPALPPPRQAQGLQGLRSAGGQKQVFACNIWQ